MKSSELQWDHANVFQIPVVVTAEAIDSYGHVNNVVYVQWLADCAWAHSAAVGLPEEICISMGRGMAVRSFHIDLLSAAHESDALCVGDWVSSNDARLRATRIFQIL
ncbi:MAG: acyl-CoA thioesterase, partial [Gammaproteobacteria bacterium]|nr:acyl-CoA thioesterase [Gammaproteobacteria bacterium]